MANEFIKNPILLITLKRGEKFKFTQQQILLAGDAPTAIVSECKKFLSTGKYSPVLQTFYGKKWKQKLLGQVEGSGELNIDSLLSDEDVAKRVVTPPTVKPIIGQVDTSIAIYADDNINQIKNKIYLLTGILPFKQHLFIQHNEDIIPLKYEIRTLERVIVNILNIMDSGQTIAEIPIDVILYQNKEQIRVDAQDHFITFGELYKRYGTTTLFMANIDDFVVSVADQFQTDMLYYGFYIKYWPMLSRDAFTTFSKTKGEKLSDSWPLLDFPSSAIAKQIANERQILRDKYDLFTDAESGYKKFPAFREYASIVTGLVKSAQITTRSFNILPIIDMRELFNSLKTTRNVPIIVANLFLGGRAFSLTKIFNGKEQYYGNYKSKLLTPFIESISLLIVYEEPIILVIDRYGTHFIKSYWNESKKMTFSSILRIIPTLVNPVIDLINAFGRPVFKSPIRLQHVRKYYSEFSKIEASIYLLKSVAIDNLVQFIREGFKEDIEAGILIPADVSGKFFLQKGIQPAGSIDYSYLTDKKAVSSLSEMLNTKTITIQHGTIGIKIDVDNLTEEEFTNFHKYISARLFRIISKGSYKEVKQAQAPRSRAKLLKMRDPVLYNFREHNSKIVYTRICQQKRQPIMYTIEEYNSFPKSVRDTMIKYWNYTTSSPVYYQCPNKKFKYLNFLAKYHPKKFCIPCCGINSPYDSEKGKRISVYQGCMQDHKYEDNQIESRYVMTYGKPLDPDRVGHLPGFLEKFIENNTSEEQLAIVAEFLGVKYSIKKILKITRNNKVKNYEVNTLLHLLPPEILQVVKRPVKNPELYKKIMEASSDPLLLNNDNEIHILDGIYRLAKAHVEGKKVVPYKNITQKQLKKIEGDQKETLKKIRHYLYGVTQNSKTNDIGALFAFATALNLDFAEYIHLVLKNINTEKFPYLLNGNVKRYFTNFDDMKKQISRLTMEDVYCPVWNELFIDIMRIYMNISTLLFDDNTPEITGTSIKIQVQNDISVIIPNIANIDQLGHDFVLLFRKFRKGKNIFSHNHVYACIFTISLHDFFKKKLIHQKIFPDTNQFIAVLSDIIKQRFILRKEPDTIFVNKSGLSYYGKFKEGIFPINYHASIGEPLMVPRKGSFQNCRIFLDNNGITPNNIIVFEGKAIGLGAGTHRYYFNPIAFTTVKQAYPGADKYTQKYDPDTINKEIQKPSKTENIDVSKALYKKYQYQLMVIEFMRYFDAERNESLRKKIAAKWDKEAVTSYMYDKKLKELDILCLNELITDANKHYDMVLLRNTFDSLTFHFDELSLNALRNNPEDTKTIIARIAKQIFVDAEPGFTEVTSCEKNAGHCKKGKMILKDKKLVEVFCNDLINPLKREYLLSSIFQFKVLNKFYFTKNKTEKIYSNL
jgi:hypothetical protein